MVFAAILRRSAAKAAPFAKTLIGTSRNAHTAATTTVKRAVLSHHFIRPAFYSSGRRFYSDNAVSTEVSADQNLLQVVQSEIDVVVENEDFDKTMELPADFPFSVEDNPGEQTVTLRREFDGEEITVEVSMPNLITGEEEEEDDDDDENDETNSNVPLLVTITKKGAADGPCLEFDCTACPDEIRINGLSLKNPETEDQLAYEGPDFFDLDENLQKAFYKYLEIRSIKPSITNFLHEYMIEKDNKEYVKWLKDVQSFVKA